MQKRYMYLDYLKGIAIILVVWGHVIQKSYGLHTGQLYFDNSIYKFIYTFHMPLFMAISGYLFYSSALRYSIREVLKRKIEGLLVPLFIWNTIYYLISILVEEGGIVTIKSYLAQVTTGLWFLHAIFIFSCILIVSVQFETGIQFFIIIMAYMVIVISPCRSTLMFEYPIFLLGFFCHKYEDKLRVFLTKQKIIACAGIGLIAQIIYMFFLPYQPLQYTELFHALRQHDLMRAGFLLLRLVYAYVVSMSMIVIMMRIAVWLDKRFAVKKYVCALSYIGRKSMEIYILQRILLELILANIYDQFIACKYGAKLASNQALLNLLYSPVITVCIILFILLIINLAEKNFPSVKKIMFGR